MVLATPTYPSMHHVKTFTFYVVNGSKLFFCTVLKINVPTCQKRWSQWQRRAIMRSWRVEIRSRDISAWTVGRYKTCSVTTCCETHVVVVCLVYLHNTVLLRLLEGLHHPRCSHWSSWMLELRVHRCSLFPGSSKLDDICRSVFVRYRIHD